MSTIIIQSEQEPGIKMVQDVLVKQIPKKLVNPYFTAEDLAGLSWIILETGDRS